MNPVYGQSAAVPYLNEFALYPVDVQFPTAERANRFWAIPIVGYLAKLIILIPHFAILMVLEIAAMVLSLIISIPVLLTGQYPSWGHTFIGGTALWRMRVGAYMFGLTEAYPAFSLSDPGNGREAVILFQAQPSYNRLFAFPFVGGAIRMLLLIPHVVIMYVLGYIVALASLISWIPVLFTGTYPSWGRAFFGGYLRWSTRVYMYLFGLVDKYPPFEFGS